MLGKKIYKRIHSPSSGYITLISVIIVSAIGFAITLAILARGVGALSQSQSALAAVRARSNAVSCVERALYDIRFLPRGASSATFSWDNETCTYSYTENPTRIYTIEATGVSLDSTKRVKAVLDTTDYRMNVRYWDDQAVF